MDDLVLRAMRRWPDVPAMYGWLRLDRRGQWWLVTRDRADFDEARDGAGSVITSPPILEFIGRNYQGDDQGRWFWQNGPQRVYVDTDAAPLVLRVFGEGERVQLVTHVGDPVTRIDAAHCDDAGAVYLATDRGPGVIHDLDLATLPIDDDGTLHIGTQRITPTVIDDAARALGFERRPRPDPAPTAAPTATPP